MVIFGTLFVICVGGDVLWYTCCGTFALEHYHSDNGGMGVKLMS